MRKILCVLLVLTISFVSVGCSKYRRFLNTPIVKKEMSKELIENLKNRDTDKIKEMFCSVVSESEGFDDQLQEAVEFIDREIVYYDNDIYGMERMKTSPGKTTIAFIAPQITNVETDTNKIYSVRFYAYLLNYDHPEYEGITMAVITRMSDSKVCVIGNISLAPSPD